MLNRRQFLGTAGAPLMSSQGTARKPNIIFILADDLGYGDLGCYGQKRIQTPVLDRIAAEGTRFTQAYAGSTVCAPSRCALMTGKHMGHATVRGNKRPELGLMPGETTVASLLKQAGYRTALIGKWGLGGPGTGSVPNSRGFEEFYGYLDQLHAHTSYPEHLWSNQDEVFLTGNWFSARKQFSCDLFTEKALDFVGRMGGAPFFLYLAYTIPHANNELGAVSDNGMEVPDDKPYSSEPWPQTERNFAAAITRMDRDIGQLMGLLRDKGIDRDTLVLFSSDNGPHREGHHDPKFFASSGPLRGAKRDLYEGGIRVPMLARWPGHVPAGVVNDTPWAFWDLLPTAAELANIPAPQGIDGISVARLLRGEKASAERTFYWEFHEGGFHQAVRQGEWKLVRPGKAPRPELYNLKDDIGEQRNVAADHPEIVAGLEKLFRSERVDSLHFPIKLNYTWVR